MVAIAIGAYHDMTLPDGNQITRYQLQIRFICHQTCYPLPTGAVVVTASVPVTTAPTTHNNNENILDILGGSSQ